MRVAYFYFMKQEPDRVRAAAPSHAAYWQALALDRYRGGPFADMSGGLIVFDGESQEHAERLVSGDPFLRRAARAALAECWPIRKKAARRRERRRIGRARERALASATWQAQRTAE